MAAPMRVLHQMAWMMFGLVAVAVCELDTSSTTPEPITGNPTVSPTGTVAPGNCEGCASGTSGPCKLELRGADPICLDFLDPASSTCAPSMIYCANITYCRGCLHGAGPCRNEASGLCLGYQDGSTCPPNFDECDGTESEPEPANGSCAERICQHGSSGDCYQPESGLCLPYKYSASEECFPNTQACGGGVPCQSCNFGTAGPCRHPDTGFCAGFVPGTSVCQPPLTPCSLTEAPSPEPTTQPTPAPTTLCSGCAEGAGSCKTTFTPAICYPFSGDGTCAAGLEAC